MHENDFFHRSYGIRCSVLSGKNPGTIKRDVRYHLYFKTHEKTKEAVIRRTLTFMLSYFSLKITY